MQKISHCLLSDATQKNIGLTVSVTLNIGLVVMDYVILQLLVEQTGKKKGKDIEVCLGIAFVVSLLATTLKLAWTIANNRQYRFEHSDNKSIASEPADEKALRHDLLQTTTKLSLGAVGWQLAFLLTQDWMGYQYDPNLKHEEWDEKFVIWLATGMGASIFLNLGMLYSQGVLFYCDQGQAAYNYLFLAAQLCLSVLAADGLWLLFTDLSLIASRNFEENGIALVVSCILYPAFYLLQSFIFKNIHNALNHIHPGGEQVKFECNNQFVGVLWGAYAGFNLIPYLIYMMFDFNLNQYNAGNIIASSLIAGVGTAILPFIIGLGNYAQSVCAVQNNKELVSLIANIEEASLVNTNPLIEDGHMVDVNLLDTTSSVGSALDILPEKERRHVNFFKRYGIYAPAVAVSRVTNQAVQLAADCYPKW